MRIWKNKADQVHTEAAPAGLKALPPAILRKGVILLASFSLLMVLVVVGVVAWYTQITNVTGVTLDVAKFDFNADYVTEDFIVQVSDYLNTASGKALPGTGGLIPVRVSQQNSEAEADYTMTISTGTMAPEFRQRIRFFYYTVIDGVTTEVTIQDGSAPITGHLNSNQTKYEYIYWEWVYDLNNTLFFDTTDNTWKSDSSRTFTDEEINAYDKIDTDVCLGEYDDSFTSSNGVTYEAMEDWTVTKVVNGVSTEITIGKKAYQAAMEVKLNINGTQAVPVASGELPANPTTGMTVLKPTA